ncbi:hypothetical protein Scep_020488 [Stephania cephalantha]|uniref:Uncharacterized protein n=1 Tax=Stephania cephalantha TaxID=152367 RepID=A0AAP0ICP9_9MAGN
MTSLAFLLYASMKLIDSLFLLNDDRFAALVPPLWPPPRFPVHLAKTSFADGRDTRVDRMLGGTILHTWVLAQYHLQFLLYGTSLLWAFQWLLRYGMKLDFSVDEAVSSVPSHGLFSVPCFQGANIMGVDTLVGCTIRVGSIYALDFVHFAMGAIFALVVLTSSYFYINKVLYEPDWDARVLVDLGNHSSVSGACRVGYGSPGLSERGLSISANAINQSKVLAFFSFLKPFFIFNIVSLLLPVEAMAIRLPGISQSKRILGRSAILQPPHLSQKATLQFMWERSRRGAFWFQFHTKPSFIPRIARPRCGRIWL